MHLQWADVEDERKVRYYIPNCKATMRRKVSHDHTDGVCINLSYLRNNFQVMFVAEVEEENIVRLTVDAGLDSIGLIGYESGVKPEVPHTGDNVVPVRLPQVEVSLFREEEKRTEPLCGEKLGEFVYE